MSMTAGHVRDTSKTLTAHPRFVVTILLLSLLLSILAGQLGTLLLYIVVLATTWATRWDWECLGLCRPNWPRTISKALLFTLGIFVLVDCLIQPLTELVFGKIDLSAVGGIEGNISQYVLFIFLGWILGGFCEEIIYRGYIVRRLAILLGDTKRSWLLSAGMTAMAFGLAHVYQGVAGAVTTSVIGLMLGMIYVYNRENLMLVILTHGIYNMLAITLIFLGKARMMTDWVLTVIR